MTNNDGHRIFVQLTGGEDATTLNGRAFNEITKVNKIFLMPAPAGESFQVLDANATDDTGAIFQLPTDVSTTWTVWARALGKPGGKSYITTCATVQVTDPVTGITTDKVLCSLATLKMERTKNAKFTNVSSYLLFVTLPTSIRPRIHFLRDASVSRPRRLACRCHSSTGVSRTTSGITRTTVSSCSSSASTPPDD